MSIVCTGNVYLSADASSASIELKNGNCILNRSRTSNPNQ